MSYISSTDVRLILTAVNRSLDALQASATQVRLEPDSEAAKRNAVFYKQRPGVTGKDFIPREVGWIIKCIGRLPVLYCACHNLSLSPLPLSLSPPPSLSPWLQDVMPVIKKQELEHSFVHIVDEVSGHLIEIMEAEERGATNEDEGTDEILVWGMGMRHRGFGVYKGGTND